MQLIFDLIHLETWCTAFTSTKTTTINIFIGHVTGSFWLNWQAWLSHLFHPVAHLIAYFFTNIFGRRNKKLWSKHQTSSFFFLFIFYLFFFLNFKILNSYMRSQTAVVLASFPHLESSLWPISLIQKDHLSYLSCNFSFLRLECPWPVMEGFVSSQVTLS